MVWVNCWINEVNGHLMDIPGLEKNIQKNVAEMLLSLEAKKTELLSHFLV